MTKNCTVKLTPLEMSLLAEANALLASKIYSEGGYVQYTSHKRITKKLQAAWESVYGSKTSDEVLK